MDIEKVFAVNLKKIRKQKDMTQNELAQKSGVSIGTISSYESGIKSPSLLIVAKLAESLDVSLDELCGFNNNKGLMNETGKSGESQYLYSEILKTIQLLIDIGILQPKDAVKDDYTKALMKYKKISLSDLDNVDLQQYNPDETQRTLQAIELLPRKKEWFMIDTPAICEFFKVLKQLNELKENRLVDPSIYKLGVDGLYNKFKDYIVTKKNGHWVIIQQSEK